MYNTPPRSTFVQSRSPRQTATSSAHDERSTTSPGASTQPWDLVATPEDHLAMLSMHQNRFRGLSQEDQDDYYAYLWTLEGAWYKKVYFGLWGLSIAIGLGIVLACCVDRATDIGVSFTAEAIDAMSPDDVIVNLALVRANLAYKSVWNDWISLPGAMLIKSLAALVVPMVFLNVTVGIADLVTLHKAAMVGARLVVLVVGTTLLAAALGTALAAATPDWLFETGSSVAKIVNANKNKSDGARVTMGCPGMTNASVGVESSGALTCGATTPLVLVDVDAAFVPVKASSKCAQGRATASSIMFKLLDDFVSNSFVGAFVQDSSLITVVLLGLPLGLVLARCGSDKTNPILAFLRQLNSIFLVMIGWVINFVPIAVVFLVASSFILPDDPTFSNGTGGRSNSKLMTPERLIKMRQQLKQTTIRQASFFTNFVSAAQAMGTLVAIVAVGTVVHGHVILPLLTFVTTRRNPMTFMAQLKKPLHFGFGSGSSLAALPMLVQAIDASRTVSRQLTRFVVPVATGIHMDGAAMYLAACTVFLLKSQPHDPADTTSDFYLSLPKALLIGLTAAVTSWSIAPIPHGGLVGLSALWSVVSDDQPANFVWVVAADVVLDRFSTYTNILSNAIVTRIIAEQIDETYVDEQDRQDVTHRASVLAESATLVR